MKNIYLVMAVIIFGAIGIGVYTIVKPSKDQLEQADTSMVRNEVKGYVPFSPEVFNSSINTRRVLFFYANWCPICLPADTSFSENADKIPADVTLIRVNYNDSDTDQAEKDLAKQYEVAYQHTFVQIDENGQELAMWNGGQIEELLANIK